MLDIKLRKNTYNQVKKLQEEIDNILSGIQFQYKIKRLYPTKKYLSLFNKYKHLTLEELNIIYMICNYICLTDIKQAYHVWYTLYTTNVDKLLPIQINRYFTDLSYNERIEYND